MLAFPAGFKIYLGVEAVDMRKQFNGFWAMAEERLKENPRQGAVFAFTNKSRDRLKLLYWDGTGRGCWRSVWKRPVQLAAGQRPREAGVDAGGLDDAAGRDRSERRLQKSVV